MTNDAAGSPPMTAPTPEQNDGSYFDSLVPRVTRADLEREMAKIVVPPKTPEQMRALADAANNLTRDNDWDNEIIGDVMSALRAAADQLEALTASEDELETQVRDLRFEVSVAADTAPQEWADGGPITSGRIWTDTAPQEGNVIPTADPDGTTFYATTDTGERHLFMRTPEFFIAESGAKWHPSRVIPGTIRTEHVPQEDHDE